MKLTLPDIRFVQGVGKHAVAWLIALAPAQELDARVRRLPTTHGLRHFSNGISGLSKISGTEHEAIFAQILGCFHGIVPDDAVRAVTALFDFFHIAQFECQSDNTLDGLGEALSRFHSLKNPDNYNTKATERLHIDLAKYAFRSTNKRDFVEQMCSGLERRESVFWFATCLAWQNSRVFDACLSQFSSAHGPVVLAKEPDCRRVMLGALRISYGVQDLKADLFNSLIDWHRIKRHRGYQPHLSNDVQHALDRLADVRTWNHAKFYTPDLQTEAAPDTLSIAYASPTRRRFDPVLVNVQGDEWSQRCVRIGRLQAIFKVPMALEQPLFGHHLPSHLASVVWYTAIPSQPNRVNGMFHVELARSTNGAIQTGIVEVLNIRRACQLIPKFGRDKVDKPLHSGNIMDAYSSFYVDNRGHKDAYRSIY
ncbi:hypothetical protein BKA62DRAFT_664021 [Auriculariales sp. MPI-PUGE-AT-0066]|nr:hypothetical protein BKA62DRAFT_664021 [Auriculariales sp. MPI-PUGE-AT-0066]